MLNALLQRVLCAQQVLICATRHLQQVLCSATYTQSTGMSSCHTAYKDLVLHTRNHGMAVLHPGILLCPVGGVIHSLLLLVVCTGPTSWY